MSSSEGSSKKQKTDEPPRTMVIKFVDQEDKDFYVNVRPHTKFAVMFKTYCEHHNLKANTARFFYDGMRVLPKYSPAELSIPDGGQIEVFAEVGGGSGFHQKQVVNK